VVGEVSTVRRDRIQVRRVPTIAADEGDVDPLLLGLFGDQVDNIVVIGQDYEIGLAAATLARMVEKSVSLEV